MSDNPIFEAIVENSPDAIARISLDGRYLYVNRAAERMPTNLKPADFIGKTIRELAFDDGTAMLVEEMHRRTIETGREQRLEISSNPWARDRIFEVRFIPEFDADGKVQSVIRISRDITDLRKTEEARLRMALDAAKMAVYTCDSELRYTWVRNPQHYLTPGRTVGRTLNDISDGRTGEALNAMKRESLRTGEPRTGQFLIRGEDGLLKWFETSVEPERDANGTIVGLVGASRDITEAKLNEMAVAGSEQRFRLAARASHAMVYDWDIATGSVYRSEAAHHITGYSVEELQGSEGWTALIHPDDAEIVKRSTEAVLAGKTDSYEVAYRVRHKDGKWRHMLDRGFVIRDGGKPQRVIGSALDVTDLRAAETRTRTLVEANLIPVFIAHDSGAISEANDAFLRMTGYSREDLERGAIRWTDMTPPEFLEFDRRWLAATRDGGRPGPPFEKEYFRKDGSRVPVMVGPAPVDGADGEYIVFALDLSEQKAAQRREQEARADAERANRAKDEFLTTLSHELRTPMTSILGWTSMLSHGLVDADTMQLALTSLHSSATAQARLIDDLLDISRIATGKLYMEMRPVDLVAIVVPAAENFRMAAADRDLDLRISTTERSLPVFGDEKRIAQIVSNLVSNAVKFTPNGGRVDVILKREAGLANVIVRDTGSGIEPVFLPHVFERFSQQDTGHTRIHGGLGLGLAIVKQLTELHGGSVRAHSDGPGTGATFTLSLPIVANSLGLAPHDEQAAKIPRLDGVQVLLIDDEIQARTYMEAVLSSFGAVVRSAGSVDEALQKSGDEHIVVSDIAMPGRDGIALITQVRVRDAQRGRRTPALAVSALGYETDRRRVLSAGFDQYLSKPVDPVLLVQTVASMVR